MKRIGKRPYRIIPTRESSSSPSAAPHPGRSVWPREARGFGQVLLFAIIIGAILSVAALRGTQSPSEPTDTPLGLGGPDGYSLDSFLNDPEDLDGRDQNAVAVPEDANDPLPAVAGGEHSPKPKPALRSAKRDRYLVRYTTHVVKRGETLSGIAARYGIDHYTLMSVNGIRGKFIRPGQRLRVPDRKGLMHVVEKNDTLEDIALRYKVRILDIVRANGIANADRIRVGQELFLPNASIPRRRRVPPASARFIRPTRGRISSGFGMRRHPISGRRTMHKGIDFASGRGAPIVAARSGVVTYAGRLGGYGKLVVIDHGQGYTTRYAHTDRILVRRGQRVKQGQRIALAGSTGYSTGPHLHFEIRLNDKPINPMKFIR